jgi:demethylmenaquinone methyltransferase / 2-methoxy-6-polyprenyl-1,4-benzoquinol methylase
MNPQNQETPQQVAVFNEVAPRYEFLNSLMTAGQDRRWREILLRSAQSALGKEPERALDLATGTGDVPRMMIERWPNAEILGTDPNQMMLDEAVKRADKNQKTKPLWTRIQWALGKAEQVDVESESLDLITMAFGFRNVPAEDRALALREMNRTLAPGGVVAILELGLPRPGMVRSLYRFLLANAMPQVAGLFSPKSPYLYLAKSIQEFPEPSRVREMMMAEGFLPFAPKPLSGGMCWLFIGRKPKIDDFQSRH